jgi:flagellin-like hook-associated protein FlgL
VSAVGSVISSARGGSLQFQNSLHRNNASAQRALERLSTGKRINRPSDDPSGFVGAEELRGEIARLEGELKQIGKSRGAIRQRESSLSEIQTALNDLKGVIGGAVGNVLSDAERTAFAQQIDASLEAVARIQSYFSRFELDGAAPAPSSLLKPKHASDPLPGIDAENLEASAAATDRYLDEATFSRAGLAAFEKYDLQPREALNTSMLETHTVALSLLEDADFAEEASNLVTAQVLAAGAQAAIALDGSISADHIGALLDGLVDDSLLLTDGPLTAAPLDY